MIKLQKAVTFVLKHKTSQTTANTILTLQNTCFLLSSDGEIRVILLVQGEYIIFKNVGYQKGIESINVLKQCNGCFIDPVSQLLILCKIFQNQNIYLLTPPFILIKKNMNRYTENFDLDYFLISNCHDTRISASTILYRFI